MRAVSAFLWHCGSLCTVASASSAVASMASSAGRFALKRFELLGAAHKAGEVNRKTGACSSCTD